MAKHTLVVYIQATERDEQELIRRAEADPKPLYYREVFLDEQLEIYMQERQLDYVALIDPDDFVRWMFSRLFYSRIPRYAAIAKQYGYTITTTELGQVTDEASFMRLLEATIAKQTPTL